jgi:hypothetical protein
MNEQRGHRRKIRAAIEALDAQGLLPPYSVRWSGTRSCSPSWLGRDTATSCRPDTQFGANSFAWDEVHELRKTRNADCLVAVHTCGPNVSTAKAATCKPHRRGPS